MRILAKSSTSRLSSIGPVVGKAVATTTSCSSASGAIASTSVASERIERHVGRRQMIAQKADATPVPRLSLKAVHVVRLTSLHRLPRGDDRWWPDKATDVGSKNAVAATLHR